MTSALISITLRALLNRRRTLLLALLGALLIGVAAIYRFSNPAADQSLEVTQRLLSDFGIGVLLPLVAVIVGTSALGSELEDGTIVYLLARPVPRWRIAIVKWLMAWLITSLLVAPAIVIAGIIGHGDAQLSLGYAVASVVGALEYCAVFVALSIMTSRALIVGLAYVVVWEGFVAGLFAGTRQVSIRQHALAVAEALGGNGAAGTAELELANAVIIGVLVTGAAAFVAIRRLGDVELRGETA
jgi:ABC-2 type transport system permease protein